MLQDRVIGVMDLESERSRYFTEDHARTLRCWRRRWPSQSKTPDSTRRSATARSCMQEDLAGRVRTADGPAAAGGARRSKAWNRDRPAAGARNLGRPLRLLPARRHACAHRVRRFERQGRRRGALRSDGQRPDADSGPALAQRRQLMKALNDALVQRKVEGRYLTLLLVAWHPTLAAVHHVQRGRLAAHGLPQRRNSEAAGGGRSARSAARPRVRRDSCFQAQPGDLVVLFSDGVSDHLDHAGEEYGAAPGLAKILRQRCADATPQEIVEQIFADLDRFNTARFDDQTADRDAGEVTQPNDVRIPRTANCTVSRSI